MVVMTTQNLTTEKKKYNIEFRIFKDSNWYKKLIKTENKPSWTNWSVHSQFNSLKVLNMVKQSLENKALENKYNVEYKVTKNKIIK